MKKKLWHPSFELPEIGNFIIVDYGEFAAMGYPKLNDSNELSLHAIQMGDVEQGRGWVSLMGMNRWCYLKDIYDIE